MCESNETSMFFIMFSRPRWHSLLFHVYVGLCKVRTSLWRLLMLSTCFYESKCIQIMSKTTHNLCMNSNNRYETRTITQRFNLRESCHLLFQNEPDRLLWQIIVISAFLIFEMCVNICRMLLGKHVGKQTRLLKTQCILIIVNYYSPNRVTQNGFLGSPDYYPCPGYNSTDWFAIPAKSGTLKVSWLTSSPCIRSAFMPLTKYTHTQQITARQMKSAYLRQNIFFLAKLPKM